MTDAPFVSIQKFYPERGTRGELLLLGHRGFSEEDAWSRVAAQIDREERRRLADVVVDNSDGQAALETEIDRVWDWLRQRAAQT